MSSIKTVPTRLLWTASFLAGFAGCGSDATPAGGVGKWVAVGDCLEGNDRVEAPRVMMTFTFRPVAGAESLALRQKVISESGVPYDVSSLIFYVSRIALLDGGVRVPAQVVDATGKALPYNLALFDIEKPESHTLRVLARAGNYDGLALGVGVPEFCTPGVLLNHADASQKKAPLNVDTNMYWGWSVGYIFLKLEGRADVGGVPGNLRYHIGDDKRFAQVLIDAPIVVTEGEPSEHTLVVDVNRLFVTPGGEHRPDLRGPERVGDSGVVADLVAGNAAGSRFLTLAR